MFIQNISLLFEINKIFFIFYIIKCYNKTRINPFFRSEVGDIMKLVKKIFDTNANITNIKCEIENRSNNPTAIISLENLGRGVITAIKFNATGYNSFGDIVPINGKKQFYIVI